MKCKPAPLPRRARHGQAQPRKRRLKMPKVPITAPFYPLPFQSWGPVLRRYPKPGPRRAGLPRSVGARVEARAGVMVRCKVTLAGPARPGHCTSRELRRPASLGKAMGDHYQEVPIPQAEPSLPGTAAGLGGLVEPRALSA